MARRMLGLAGHRRCSGVWLGVLVHQERVGLIAVYTFEVPCDRVGGELGFHAQRADNRPAPAGHGFTDVVARELLLFDDHGTDPVLLQEQRTAGAPRSAADDDDICFHVLYLKVSQLSYTGQFVTGARIAYPEIITAKQLGVNHGLLMRALKGMLLANPYSCGQKGEL